MHRHIMIIIFSFLLVILGCNENSNNMPDLLEEDHVLDEQHDRLVLDLKEINVPFEADELKNIIG